MTSKARDAYMQIGAGAGMCAGFIAGALWTCSDAWVFVCAAAVAFAWGVLHAVALERLRERGEDA